MAGYTVTLIETKQEYCDIRFEVNSNKNLTGTER